MSMRKPIPLVAIPALSGSLPDLPDLEFVAQIREKHALPRLSDHVIRSDQEMPDNFAETHAFSLAVSRSGSTVT
jgi:hypothetical protein